MSFRFLNLLLFGLLWVGCGSRLPELPAGAYVENPRNFAGNQYHLNCQIEELVSLDTAVGRLFVVKEKDTETRLAVLLPQTLQMNVGEAFQFLKSNCRWMRMVCSLLNN